MAETVEEHVARVLARRAGDSEENWQNYLPDAERAIVAMRQATPEILAAMARNL